MPSNKRKQSDRSFIFNPEHHSKQENREYIFDLYEAGFVAMSEILADYCKERDLV